MRSPSALVFNAFNTNLDVIIVQEPEGIFITGVSQTLLLSLNMLIYSGLGLVSNIMSFCSITYIDKTLVVKFRISLKCSPY